MVDFSFVNEPDPSVLSIIKQYYTQTNGNNGGNYCDYDIFCLHSKASTLRSIQGRTANCSIHDGVLDSLILIDELDRRRGVPPSDAMREAFCAVAVHLTLWWLPVSWDDYHDAVRRIWGKKIGNLEMSDASGLLSTGLGKWRKEIEEALWDRETTRRLLGINTLDEALRLIRVYLKEACRRFPGDPTVADDVAYVPASAATEGNEILRANSHTKHKLHSSRVQHKIAGLQEDQPSCTKNDSQSDSDFNGLQKVPFKAMTGALVDEVNDSLSEALDDVEMVASGTKNETSHVEGIEEDSDKDIGILAVNSRTRCDPSSSRGHCERPAVIVDREDRPSCRKYVSLSSAEIDKARDSLKSSIVDLVANVDDPLPKALEIAERIVSYVAEAKKLHPEGDENKEQGAPDEAIRKDYDRMDGNVPTPFADHIAEPSQAKEGNEAFTRPKKVLRTGLMERNNTARCFEWEDSIDDTSEETNSCLNSYTLPSPRTKHVSPLNIDKPKRWGRMRKINRWTDEEEKTLTEGVQKYGNQWARILETYQEIFKDRTAVDLKDKWRNLLRK
ncbi:uncharacterized protein LOC120183373 isoform X2 [Hibiscus syriacus]|uniref:uncharacterized protein LOC120183373 isoform X2 n=1 Tax=Hibiscus syriacus TaxID=106335 RepID=UPI0019242BE9|nr:uncharacterized protein LOC120183373 isoform X2 [Hibiscus syriacus]